VPPLPGHQSIHRGRPRPARSYASFARSVVPSSREVEYTMVPPERIRRSLQISTAARPRMGLPFAIKYVKPARSAALDDDCFIGPFLSVALPGFQS